MATNARRGARSRQIGILAPHTLLNGEWQVDRSTQALGVADNDVPWPNVAGVTDGEASLRFLVETSSVPVFLTVRIFGDTLRNDGSPARPPIVEIDCDYQELRQTTPGECFVGTIDDGMVVSIPDTPVDRHTRIALGIYWAGPPDDPSSGVPRTSWGTWLFNVSPSDRND